MLFKYGKVIKVTAKMHPLATTAYSEMEQEVKQAAATYMPMLQYSGDLDVICKEEGRLKELVISLVWEKTAGYNLDKNK